MTGLCHIPGCRVRGRHLGDCESFSEPGECTGCLPRTTDAGYACDWHTERTADHLAAIVALAGDARAVARGEVRRGSGGGSGKPGSRPPLNDGATDALDAVANTLTTLARDIAEMRGIDIPGLTRRSAA